MSPTRLNILLAAALALPLLAGCMGTPPGAAAEGDAVTIRYTAYDLRNGTELRADRAVTFTAGEGGSGLGGAVDQSVLGRRANDTYEVRVVGDPGLQYSESVGVNRTLAPIPVEQTAPTADFERYLGEAFVGQTFDAYGVYTGQVTNVTNETIAFRVLAQDGQRDPLSIGVFLVATVTETHIRRTLDPVVGATFTLRPPGPSDPPPPLGLTAGSYKVVGATDGEILYLRSASVQPDLVGRDLRIVVQVLDVVHAREPVPTGGNFGVRDGSQASGDPSQVLGSGAPVPSQPTDEGHETGH